MIIDKALKLRDEFQRIESEMSVSGVISDRQAFQEKAKRYSDLKPVMELLSDYEKTKTAYDGALELLETETDPEMKDMALSEKEESQAKLMELEEKIALMMIERDPNDHKNIIMEIRAGTGGDEAGLFAAELYKMYLIYAEKEGFKCEVADSSPTELGGLKEVIFMIYGKDAYARFKFESGTHRVQRVPKTETGGRVHTSAVTVAVLPEQEEKDFSLNPDDLKIEVCRASGAGGQHVNKTESAVRIVHLPTGLEVYCQDGRSQIKNKEKGMTILAARVKNKLEGDDKAKIDSQRKLQIGSGDRSEKIRTYNFPQNRVTDHRIGYTMYNLAGFMEGDIGEVIGALAKEHKKKQMEQE